MDLQPARQLSLTLDTERLLLEGTLSGEFAQGATTFTPDLRLLVARERQHRYRVTDGLTEVAVRGRDAELGQLSLGLKVSHDVAIDQQAVTPFVAGRVFWDFDNPGEIAIDGTLVSTGDLRAAVSLGLDYRGDRTRVSLEATYDGLTEPDYRSLSGKLGLEYRF